MVTQSTGIVFEGPGGCGRAEVPHRCKRVSAGRCRQVVAAASHLTTPGADEPSVRCPFSCKHVCHSFDELCVRFGKLRRFISMSVGEVCCCSATCACALARVPSSLLPSPPDLPTPARLWCSGPWLLVALNYRSPRGVNKACIAVSLGRLLRTVAR